MIVLLWARRRPPGSDDMIIVTTATTTWCDELMTRLKMTMTTIVAASVVHLTRGTRLWCDMMAWSSWSAGSETS
jgi:hypothetical protein